MKLSDLYDRIREYVKQASGLEDDRIYFQGQSSPRNLKPCIVISLTSFKKIGQPVKKTLDAEGKQQIVSSMTCVASFKAFSDTLHEAEIMLHDLYHSFDTELRNQVFKGEIALHRILKEVMAIPKAIDSQYEGFSVFDAEFAFLITHEQNTGIIEKVEISETIEHAGQEITEEYTISR